MNPTTTQPDWAAHRAQIILDPSINNLNTGSFGPLPEPVFAKVTEYRRMLAAEPTHFFVRQAPPLLWHARERTAAYLGTIPERLVFTTNVSAAINLVASGLTIPTPGEILLTDHEYGAMHWCWQRVAQRSGLTIRTFPLPTRTEDPQAIIDAATHAMTKHTRLFFFSHVLSPTGLVLPAQELCAEAKRRGILTVVDGAHAAAMIPLNVSAVGADFYTGNLHKWLLAPTGSGFLVVGSGNEDRLQPLHVSWGYRRDTLPKPIGPDERDAYGSTPRTRHLEFEGTRDICPWLAVPDAIDFQTAIGVNAIRDRIEELVVHTRQRFTALGMPLATPVHRQLHGALTAFELPLRGQEAAARLRAAIWKHRIEVPIIERPDRLMIRVSTHFYDTPEAVDQLANVLPTALAECGA